tara:strand:+ start:3357 stop:3713 length:357 start_codon:yes stop_codon:yes gene_type:complete
MKNILVTGGAGFIGRNFVKRILKENYHVTIVDNLYRWDKEVIQDISDKVEFIKGDICNKRLINRLVKNNDVILHLAGMSQVITAIKEPQKCFDYNVTATHVIAKACAENNKKLISFRD